VETEQVKSFVECIHITWSNNSRIQRFSRWI